MVSRLGSFHKSALITLCCLSLLQTASAQSTRITRSDIDRSRPLPSGGLGTRDELRPLSSTARSRSADYSKIDRRTVATLMRDALDESGKLYAALDADYRRNPQLRSLLADLGRLRSQTNRINQDLAAGVDLSLIVEDFRTADADWRIFSTRFSQTRGLSSATQQSFARIDQLDRQIGKLFQVEPTLDRRSLLQQLSSLENSLQFLTDELARDPAVSTQIISSGRKLQQRISRVVSMVVDEYPYDKIVSEYNGFDQSLIALMPQLTSIRNPYIERTIQRLASANDLVHELLWMENTTSNAELKRLAAALMQDVDQFYTRTSLVRILSFKDPARSLSIASDFYGTVQNFRDLLDRGEADNRVAESYTYVEEEGRRFLTTFRQTKVQAVITELQEIEDDIAAIRRELNIGDSAPLSQQTLRPVAASLEDLADQLDLDIRQWLNSERPTYRNEAMAASAAFLKRTQQMHRMVDVETRPAELQREVDAVFNEWQKLYSFLERCRTTDRSTLAWRARLINEVLTDLDTQLRP